MARSVEGETGYAGTGILKDLSLAALDTDDGEHLQDDIHCHNAVTGCAGEVHFDHLRHGKHVFTGGHCQRHIVTACAEVDGAHAASIHRMAVGADTGHARFGEVLNVEEVADPGAGRREDNAKFLGYGSQILVIIRVTETGLHHAVINKIDREGFYPFYAHGFQLQHAHGAGGILCERLVNRKCHHCTCSWQVTTFSQMCTENLFRQVHRLHSLSPIFSCNSNRLTPVGTIYSILVSSMLLAHHTRYIG